MKINTIIPNVKVLNVEEKSNYDGSIHWYEVVLFQDSNCNTVTCDTKVASVLKSGQSYDLVLTISEVPKAYKNGAGAYIESKFKITKLLTK